MFSPGARCFGAVLVGAVLSACAVPTGDFGDATEETGGGAGDSGLQLDSIAFVLDWQAAVGPAIGDVAWEVETDLGYKVRLHSGWTTLYGMSLIPCEAGDLTEPDLLADVRGLFEIKSAWAGHGGVDDPSAAYGRYVENLANPEAIDYAQLDFEGLSYCQLHFVYGPANAETPGLPAQPDMVGNSVHVVGSWQPPGGGEWTEFTLAPSHADGEIIDFDAGQLGPIDGRVEFRLRRDWRGIFEGIDFETASNFDLEVAVLRALVESTVLEIGAN